MIEINWRDESSYTLYEKLHEETLKVICLCARFPHPSTHQPRSPVVATNSVHLAPLSNRVERERAACSVKIESLAERALNRENNVKNFWTLC